MWFPREIFRSRNWRYYKLFNRPRSSRILWFHWRSGSKFITRWPDSQTPIWGSLISGRKALVDHANNMLEPLRRVSRILLAHWLHNSIFFWKPFKKKIMWRTWLWNVPRAKRYGSAVYENCSIGKVQNQVWKGPPPKGSRMVSESLISLLSNL